MDMQEERGLLPHDPARCMARYRRYKEHGIMYCAGGESEQPAWWWDDIEFCAMLEEYGTLPAMIKNAKRQFQNVSDKK
jgi:hypothetical protein